jgi:hypothetical protein
MKLTVIGILTRWKPTAADWENSLKALGYNYEIVGMGKKWEGWHTKTKYFLEYLRNQPDDEEHIYWLTDVDDVFFQLPPMAAMNAYRSILNRKGLEWGSIVESAHSRCSGRYTEEFKDFCELPKKDFLWGHRVTINAGSVMGSRNKLISFESESMKIHPDDQVSHVQVMSRKEMCGKYYIDKYNELTATILPSRIYDKQPHYYLKHGNLYLEETGKIPIAVHTPVQYQDLGTNTEKIRNYLYPNRDKISTNVYMDRMWEKSGTNVLWAVFGILTGVLLILLIMIGVRSHKRARTTVKSRASA